MAGYVEFFGCCHKCADGFVCQLGPIVSVSLISTTLEVVFFSFCCLVLLQLMFEFLAFLVCASLPSTFGSVCVLVVCTVVVISVC